MSGSRYECPPVQADGCGEAVRADRGAEEKKMTMKKLLKIIPAVSFVGTVVFSILYENTSLEILLTLAITLGTVTYHFAMRLLVAFLYHSAMKNRADYSRRWYQVSKAEMRFYEKLRVKRWKNKMPTYSPNTFDPRQHTWDEIAQAILPGRGGA